MMNSSTKSFAARDGDLSNGSEPVVQGIAEGRSIKKLIGFLMDLPGTENLATGF